MGFFCGSNPRFGGRQSTRYHGFPLVGLKKTVSRTRKNMSPFQRFCNNLLQDLTPLHVNITTSMNLLSVFRRKLKLSTYLHSVSYKHINFLNTRSKLVWVLASSGFYSITWRMISSKIHFRKQPPFRRNFFPFRCDIFRFFEFILSLAS